MFTFQSIFSLMALTVFVFAGIGVMYCRGRIIKTDDFITARDSADTKMLAGTLMASFLGVFLLFTPPEAGALGGMPAIIGYALGVGSLYLAFLVLSPKIRAYLPEGSTLTDYVAKRYGAKMQGLTSLLSIFYMFVHLVAELTAIGLVAYQLAEIPLLYTALLIGLGTMIYTAYGGLRASMFTDMIQMILVVFLLAAATAGVVYYGGGIKEILSKVSTSSPGLLSLNNWGGIEYGLTLCIAVFAANLFHQGYWQRIYAGKDDSTIRKSLIVSISLVIPVMLLTGFLGIVSSAFNTAGNPSVALFALVYDVFPKGLIIAVFLLALVLVMSTVDTLLNSIVATLTVDSRRIFPRLGEYSLLKLARWITVILIFPATLIAAKGYSVLYLFFVADLICAGVFFPLFFGLFSKSCSEKTALLASFLGVASGVPLFIAGKLMLSFLLPVVVSSIVCLASVLVNKRGQESKKIS